MPGGKRESLRKSGSIGRIPVSERIWAVSWPGRSPGCAEPGLGTSRSADDSADITTHLDTWRRSNRLAPFRAGARAGLESATKLASDAWEPPLEAQLTTSEPLEAEQ